MSTEDRHMIGATPTAGQLESFAAGARAAGRRLVIGALISDDLGRIYVQRRSLQRKLFPGCWDLVGGHVEAGEGLEEALAREVREETGWRLKRLGPVVEIIDWSADDGVARREVDLLVRVEGDLANPYLEPGKHDEGRWLTADELPALLEGRGQNDQWLHATVARAFEILARP